MSDKVLNQKTKSRLSDAVFTGEKIPRVLLAEDDNDMRKLLALSLRKYGYEVVECTDGNQLLDHIGSLFFPCEETEAFHLIISDIRMPGVTGLEVLEDMHMYKTFPPMILITAFGDEEIHAQARRLGAAAIFDKPFDIDELMDKVQAIVPL